MKKAMVKLTPEMVATFLVSTLIMASANSATVISTKPEGDLRLADVEIQRHLPFAPVRLLVAQHQHRERLHGEAPHHAEGVSFAQHVDIAAADDDGDQLQTDDQVDEARGGAELACADGGTSPAARRLPPRG